MTMVACAVVMWCTFYAIVRQYPKGKFIINGKEASEFMDKDLRNRFVSLCHALGCIGYSTYHYIYVNPPECGAINTDFQRKCMIFSMSYFIYDTLAMWYDGLLDTAMMIHHPLCIFGMYLPLYENTQGNFAMLAVYMTEISNPSMTSRHLLRLTGRRYTITYELCEISFLALYIWGRALSSWMTIWRTLTCQHNHMFFKITCIGLTIQSIFFVSKMKSVAVKRYVEIQKRRSLGVKYNWIEPLSKAEMEKL